MVNHILLSINAGVAEVRLNRPEKINAVDPTTLEALVTVGKYLINEADLHAAVLSGEGRTFCAGLDMGSMASLGSNDAGSDINAGRLAKHAYGAANLPQYACTVWRDLSIPVLAAVHGVAYGDDLQIALGASVRYVAADTYLLVMEIKWGLVSGMDGMALMRDLARPDRLREPIYSGYVVNGEEAFTLGLVTYIVDGPRAAALAAVCDTMPKSSDIIRAGKRLIRVAEDGDTAAALLAKPVKRGRLIGTDNQCKAILAGIQNHASVFQPAAKSEQKLEIAWGRQLR